MARSEYMVALVFDGPVTNGCGAFGNIDPLCVSLNCHDAEKARRELEAAVKKYLQAHIAKLLAGPTVVRIQKSFQSLKDEFKHSAEQLSPGFSCRRPAKDWARAISNTKFYNFAVVWSGQEPFIAFEDRPRAGYSELTEEEQLIAALPITERGSSIQSGNITSIEKENWPLITRVMEQRNGIDSLCIDVNLEERSSGGEQEASVW